ncbi:MAG: TonB-dependent receptor [Proteobacteria bacterium]|nr:TonB-dependent receptor [Pseudomonadota bacterium]
MSLIPLAARAADAPAGGSTTIETVVVTAEKRTQDSQRVAIALTALDGKSLDAQGIIGFNELGMRTPGLRFGAGVTGGENVITMRGLGSQNTTPGGDSPVAYSVDGVTLQRSTSVDPEFYDIERIEVLRGPQGTLYGRNSVGGSINVITAKPTDTLGGSFDVLLGDYAQRTFRGWFNAPLVDDPNLKIYARVTAVSAQHNPYSKNLSTAPTATHNQDGQDFQMIRGQVYVELSQDFNLLFSASSTNSSDPAATNVAWWETPTRYMTGTSPIAPGSACDFSTQAKYNPRVFCHDYPENAFNHLALYNATANYNLGWATLTSVTGYATSNVSQTSDGDGSDAPMAYGSSWILRQHQISEELRLASAEDENDPLKWIFGLYYFWSNNYEDFAYSDNGLNDTSIVAAYDQYNFLSHGNSKSQSFAPFGQIDYDLSKTSLGIPLTLTAGIRYSYDRKYGYNYLDYQLPLVCFGSCGVSQGPFSQTWGQWTGKVGLTYQVSDRIMAYASASRGYLSGGNIIGLAHIYGPESMWSYDVGMKSRFFDDRLQLNIAGYHEEIEHLQVFVQSSTQSGINNVNGVTQVNGVEVEATVLPVDNLQLNATLTLNRATYGNYITTDTRFGGPGPGCDPLTLLCNFRGNSLNQTPPYTFDIGAEYTFYTPFGTLTPRVDAFFSGKVQFLPDNYFTSTQKPYHLTNLHLTWLSTSGRYKAEAFVNNIEDEAVISNDGLQSISLGQQALEPDNFAYYPPRTFGVRFGVNL